jgi:hypothetical protein
MEWTTPTTTEFGIRWPQRPRYCSGRLNCNREAGPVTHRFADSGFDEKYERDYNVFNPINLNNPNTPFKPLR